jgi:hypothetical protein
MDVYHSLLLQTYSYQHAILNNNNINWLWVDREDPSSFRRRRRDPIDANGAVASSPMLIAITHQLLNIKSNA